MFNFKVLWFCLNVSKVFIINTDNCAYVTLSVKTTRHNNIGKLYIFEIKKHTDFIITHTVYMVNISTVYRYYE